MMIDDHLRYGRMDHGHLMITCTVYSISHMVLIMMTMTLDDAQGVAE